MKHVGIHCHAHGEDDTGNTWQGKGGSEQGKADEKRTLKARPILAITPERR